MTEKEYWYVWLAISILILLGSAATVLALIFHFIRKH
jgi:hypothetical protein